MSNQDYLKKWEVVTRDGKKAIVETYTKDAQVFNADGSPAKVVFPKSEVKSRKTSRKDSEVN